MIKTVLFYGVCLAPVLFGLKLYATAISLSDQHMIRIADCMNRKTGGLDIGAKEAYIVCEKENRR